MTAAVLAQLIPGAQATRDRESATLVQARQAWAQAAATLQQLRDFRTECLGRSPAAHLGRTDATALAGYQRFVARLDEAITRQAHFVQQREAAANAQQQRLAEAQRRLLAFETLVQRDAQRRQAREQRREQRSVDEFAARVHARQQSEAYP